MPGPGRAPPRRWWPRTASCAAAEARRRSARTESRPGSASTCRGSHPAPGVRVSPGPQADDGRRIQLRRQLRGGGPVQQPQRAAAAAGAGRRGLDLARRRTGRCATAPALSSPAASSHTSRAARIAGQGQRDPGRRRLGRAVHADHRALASPAPPGCSGKSEATWVSGPTPEHQDVERGHRRRGPRARPPRPVLPRTPRPPPPRRGRAGRRTPAWRAPARGRPATASSSGLAGLGDVALRVALGQEPLVAPPQVQPRPVHRVPGRRRRRGRRAARCRCGRR